MMFRNFALLAVWVLVPSLFCGCMTTPLSVPTIPPKTTYKIEQADLSSPNEQGWVLMNNEIHSVVFAKKREEKGQTALLSGMMYSVGLKKNSKEFLDFVVDQRTKNDDKDRFKNLKLKNEYVTFKGLPCLKYETLSEDHGEGGSSNFKYFKTLGYVCRYPLEYIGFQFEVSQRSNEKEIPADLLKTARTFFDEIKLVEATVKRLKDLP